MNNLSEALRKSADLDKQAEKVLSTLTLEETKYFEEIRQLSDLPYALSISSFQGKMRNLYLRSTASLLRLQAEREKKAQEEMRQRAQGIVTPALQKAREQEQALQQQREESDRLQREKLRQEYQEPAKRREAGIPPIFMPCTMSYILHQGLPERLYYVHQRVGSFIANMDKCLKKGTGLIFSGPCGTLKTTFAVTILHEAFNRGYNGRFALVMELMDQLTYLNRENKSEYQRLMRQLCTIPLLVLDDLGAEGNRLEYVRSMVEQIIFRRHANMLSTIVTTNLDYRELKKLYTDRIMDRLLERNPVLETTGKSFREAS